MSPSPKRRVTQSKYADVQVETTRMVFDGVMPTILTGCISIVGATVIMAVHYGDRLLGWLAVVTFATSCARIVIVRAFNAKPRPELNAVDAYRWELAYGMSIFAYVSAIAGVTTVNFRYHDYSAQGWCAMGMFAIASGLGARLALRPWIAQAAGLVMLLTLTCALIGSDKLLVRCSASSVIAYMYLYCESIKTKHRIVVDQIRTKRQLLDLSQHDALTGLANRRHFESRLAAACRQSSCFGIFYIDLDKFKAVNDNFGHGTGDSLLQSVAARLRRIVRETDLIARIGGDEFAVLQSAPVTEASAQALATRINRDLASVFEIDGHHLTIGASIGIRLAADSEDDAASLLRNADSALYRVKQNGGGGFSFAERRILGSIQAAS